MSIVSVVKTNGYDGDVVLNAVKRHFQLLEVAKRVKPTDRVVLKPNLLMKRRPEQGTTTHSEVVRAVVICLKELGVKDITIADSPGGPYTKTALSGIYSATGMQEVAELEGVKLNYDTTFKTVKTDMEMVKSFEIITPLVEADFIINIPKLKTHAMTGLSSGVKNLFGSVPGLKKPEFHFRFPDKDRFCNMLVDLADTVKADLTILDAIVSMEGDGPSSGQLKQTNMTLASYSPFDLDRVVCEYIDLDPDQIYTVSNSVRRGLTCRDVKDITLLGDELTLVKDFLKPGSKSIKFSNHMPKLVQKTIFPIVEKRLAPKPVVVTKQCIGCGKCAESCPASIIKIRDKKAVIDYGRCIRCFCCHEMCPVKAIKIGRFLLWR